MRKPTILHFSPFTFYLSGASSASSAGIFSVIIDSGLGYATEGNGCAAIAQQVQAVSVSAGSYSYPLWIVACEYKGIIRLHLVCSMVQKRDKKK